LIDEEPVLAWLAIFCYVIAGGCGLFVVATRHEHWAFQFGVMMLILGSGFERLAWRRLAESISAELRRRIVADHVSRRGGSA
jgi:hypothetical protein